MDRIKALEETYPRAKQLQLAALPQESMTLTVLVAATETLRAFESDETKSQIHSSYGLTPPVLAAIGEQTGLPPAVISNVLDQFYRLDLRDDSQEYERLRSLFQASGVSKAEASQKLRGDRAGNCRYFVLNKIILVWHFINKELYDEIIELDSEYDLCRGYLVERGFAFETTVDLLWDSFRSSWPEWPSLWRYF